MSNLVIDIGNTNIKLAIFKQLDIIHYQQVGTIDHSALTQLIEMYDVENAAVSSVNKGTDELSGFLTSQVNYVPFSTAITGTVKNYYGTTSTLGLDRWAMVIAAQGLFPHRNCLMIDAGTCITYDLLTAGNEYFGGSISPGIRMRFEALNHFTKRLPLVDWNREHQEIPKGNNTNNAIKNGVLQGVVNEVEGFIREVSQENKDLTVVLTGGDADFLTKQLKNSIFATQIIHEPYFVLKGLNEAITLYVP